MLLGPRCWRCKVLAKEKLFGIRHKSGQKFSALSLPLRYRVGRIQNQCFQCVCVYAWQKVREAADAHCACQPRI